VGYQGERGRESVREIFELSFRWQDGAVQVIIYALVIYLGLVRGRERARDDYVNRRV
jgi:hypothetical protein